MLSKPAPEFSFAGFTFPKFVWDLPRGPVAKRIQAMKHPCTGGYYHAPKPLGGPNPGTGFYLDSDGMPGLRWKWADDVVSLRHTGWFFDDFQDTKIRGLVMRLPHSAGFLAGWSMGEGMASEVDGGIYPDEPSAAHAADSMAEDVAEREREYQENEEQKREAAEQEAEDYEENIRAAVPEEFLPGGLACIA